MLFEEKDLEGNMRTIACPKLTSVKEEGYLETKDGKLFYEIYIQKEPCDTIIICHGFCESTRKFDEFCYYLYEAGYQIAIYDQRGHGQSFREGKYANTVYIHQFSEFVDDLNQFITEVVKKYAKKQMILYAHSMGGCVGTLYLEQYPGTVDAAILNAPMLGINMGACPAFIAKSICFFQKMAGKEQERVFFQNEYSLDKPFARSCADSNARYTYYQKFTDVTPAYQTCAASYSWVNTSIDAGNKAMKPENLNRITVPVLLFVAEKDDQVKNKRLYQFAKVVTNTTLLFYKNTSHEIYRAGNEVLTRYMKDIFNFLLEFKSLSK